MDKEIVCGVLKSFDKIGEDDDYERSVLRQQPSRLQDNERIFGSNDARVDVVLMNLTTYKICRNSQKKESIVSSLLAALRSREFGAFIHTFFITHVNI